MITVADLTGSKVRPYFRITHDRAGIEITEQDLKLMSISISVTEKEREFTVCTLTIKDELGVFDKLFSYGAVVSVEWGLKKVSPFLIKFSDEVDGEYSRGPMKFSVLSASPSLRDGTVYANINMRSGTTDSNDRKTRSFTSGAVITVMNKVVAELQATATIDFKGSTDVLSVKNQMNQNNETNIAFLHRMSAKYNFKLVYQHDANFKQYKIYMIDWAKQDSYSLPEMRGLKGKYHYFDYATHDANIIDGDFDTNNSTPLGSNAEIRIGSDGKLVLINRPAGQEKAEVYVLNEAKIKADLKRGTFADQASLLNTVLAADTEDFVKKGGLRDQYFRRDYQMTAPEGNGWTADFNVVANPLYQVGDRVVLGTSPESSPIPPRFKSIVSNGVVSQKSTWRITQLEHTISGDGYEMKVGCAK